MADALASSAIKRADALRVIHLIDKAFPPSADDGGAPQYVATLTQAQNETGHKAWVATTSPGTSASALKVQTHRDKGEQLLKLAQEMRADIVHFHAHAEELQDTLAEAGMPSVCHVHGDHYGSVPSSHNRIYVSASHAKRHCADVYVHNGIDVTKHAYVDCPSNYLVFLGKVRRSKKGVDVAVDVAKRTNQQLRIIGGRKLSILETWLPLNRKIRAMGVLGGTQKSEVLSQAKALLFPVKWEEPFGLVLIEAMACGVPVIAFNRGAVPEIVQHGETGFIVDDINEMAEAIDRVGEIDRAKCRGHVSKNFSLEKTVSQMDACYRRAIAGDTW